MMSSWVTIYGALVYAVTYPDDLGLYLSYMVNTIAVDDLAMQGARSSAAMVLT